MTAEQAEYAALAYPHPLRRHQREALDALGVARAAGRQRAWVVLPPGAGKTLVGLETIRREGRRAVVLCPNTAIQGQWVRGWRDFGNPSGANPIAVGSDRDLATPVTALTYQSLAVFDDEPDDAEGGAEAPVPRRARPPPRQRQGPGGTLQEAGPITLVLDECHHLLEVWGRLLGELLDLLPDATVLGLTATPATTLTPDQAVLVDQLFGDVVYSASIPAVVREGHLAPFADLIWLTTPSTTEAQWLAEQNQRFAELTTQLLDPSFGSVPFLTWVDRRFAGEVRFDRIAREAAAARPTPRCGCGTPGCCGSPTTSDGGGAPARAHRRRLGAAHRRLVRRLPGLQRRRPRPGRPRGPAPLAPCRRLPAHQAGDAQGPLQRRPGAGAQRVEVAGDGGDHVRRAPQPRRPAGDAGHL